MKSRKLLAALLAVLMVVALLAGCSDPKDPDTPNNPNQGDDPNQDPNQGNNPNQGDNPNVPQVTYTGPFTYRSYTTKMPSNWNELTYEDANDTQILDYIVSSFFEYDFKFEDGKKYNADGSINAEGIVPGDYTVQFSAATKLEDVTATVDAKWGYTDEQKAEGGYAWKITLREDLKWDDGTPIDASDFVYTMQEQLNPLFKHMRASSYYNLIMVKNARAYVYQGDTVDVDNGEIGLTIDNLVMGADGVYTLSGYSARIPLTTGLSWLGGNTLTDYVETYKDTYFNMEHWEDLKALADADGNVAATEEAVGYLGSIISTAAWNEDETSVVNYMVTTQTYPALDFSEVGYYSPSKYELVVCLDDPIKCLKDDGSFSYLAAYSFQSMPLVKKDLYESCKQPPKEGATLWTTTYNSSVETTASWGPYKLSAFQSGKSYEFTKNEYWYGYNMDLYKNQYLVDKITCEEVEKIETQWIKFLGGEIDDVGLDVNHKADYRDSKYTKYAPGTGTLGINIYSNLDVLKTSGRNNGILAIQDFRKAFSLYFDRDDYNATVSTANKSCYGLMGPAYYYDIESGGVYRDTKQAKEGLLRVYGFTENDNGSWTDGQNTYPTYEDAYEVMNGMNRPLAKELVEKAYQELTANPDKYGYDPSKKITILFGTSADNESSRRQYDYLVKALTELVAGTSLEGKIEIPFDSSFGENWSKDFKAGAYDLTGTTGYQGGPFDPFGFLQCYMDLESGLMYSVWWDPDKESMTFTMPAGDYPGAGQELTMSAFNWYCCLNGMAISKGCKETYNWSEGYAPAEARLALLSKLEELVLSKYYAIMSTSIFSASVYGAKFETITDEYNVFMGFGGIRYFRPVYNDTEWAEFVKANNNDLTNEYKKAE